MRVRSLGEVFFSFSFACTGDKVGSKEIQTQALTPTVSQRKKESLGKLKFKI